MPLASPFKLEARNESDQLLVDLMNRWHALLQAWALSGAFAQAAEKALHLSSTDPWLQSILHELASGNTVNLPPIQLLDSQRMSGALGAYSAEKATIYLNRQRLARAGDDEILAVLTEELGHHLDAAGNLKDTAGDEGKYFAALLTKQDAQAAAFTSDAKGIILDENGQATETEFSIESVVPIANGAQDAEYGNSGFSTNGEMGIAPVVAGDSNNFDYFFGKLTFDPYYWGTRLYRGDRTSTIDRLTIPFDRSLSTLFTTPSGLPVWQIYLDAARTKYITAFTPYIEDVFFSAGTAASLVSQASAASTFSKDVLISYLKGGDASDSGHTGFEGAGAKDYFIGRPWFAISNSSIKPASDPFVVRGGAESDTLFVPYKQGDAKFEYIEELGIGKLLPPAAKSGPGRVGAAYITLSLENYEFLDGTFKSSGLSDYNIINANPSPTALGVVSATNILGTFKSRSSIGTGGDDFFITSASNQDSFSSDLDGLSGKDILYLPRYKSSQIAAFLNPSSGTHQLLFADGQINLRNFEYLLFSDKAFAISPGSAARRAIHWLPDSGFVPKTYNLVGNSSTAEGDAYQVELQTTGVANGATLYWRIAHGTTNADDFEPNNTQGSATIQSGRAEINLQVKADASTEGSQSATLEVYTDSSFTNRVASKNFVINDTSISASYSVTAPPSVNESSTYIATLNSTNSLSNQVVYWKVINGTTNSADFTSPLQGSATLAQGSAQATIDIAADLATEGPQSATIRFYSDANFTSEIASKPFTINDTSTSSGGATGGGSGSGGGSGGGGTGSSLDQLDGDFSDPFNARLVGWQTTAKLGPNLQHPVSEGDSVTATIQIEGVSQGDQVMYSWIYSSEFNQADQGDYGNAASGVATVNSSGRISVSNYLSRDEESEGTESGTLYISGNSRNTWGWIFEIRDTSRNTRTLDSYTTVESLSNRYSGLRLLGGLSVAASGNNLDNTINGNTGNNILRGLNGLDILIGGAGADTLLGDGGADVLEGGSGNDRLTGGGEADRFVLRQAPDSRPGSSQRDVITDFLPSQGDRIDLASMDANSRAAGNQAFRWIGAKRFGGKPAQLRYSSGLLSGDLNGDKKSDFEIQLLGAPGISATQIIL